MDFWSWAADVLLDMDERLLLLLNGVHTHCLDYVMWMMSNRWVWVPLYILLVILLFRKFSLRSGAMVTVMVVILITLTDQTCAAVIRPAVCRLRPSSPDNGISAFVLLVDGYRGGMYGFPSCHAANTFALAVFMSLLFKNRRFTILAVTWSLMVSYSRIYLGVHYPGDILGGFIVGGIYAALCFRMLWLICPDIRQGYMYEA